MGKTRPRFGLEEGKVAEVDRSGCGGCGSPLAKNRQPPEPRMTPSEFLKNNQKMYSSGCATGSTSLGTPMPGLPTEWCLDHAHPLEKIMGLTVRGRSLFKGAPGMEESDQPSRSS